MTWAEDLCLLDLELLEFPVAEECDTVLATGRPLIYPTTGGGKGAEGASVVPNTSSFTNGVVSSVSYN